MSKAPVVEPGAPRLAPYTEPNKLLIVIPALNEEQSIRSIIERSLAARAYICEHAPVEAVDIAVVSDGSVDRTVEYASAYLDEIELIIFEENRGYGAAIKEAWQRSDASLLGFLDADGTCDPRFFAPLCTALEENEADVVLGCRMNPESKMPAVRKFGNFIFASMLSALSSTRIQDSASGMRVIRRSSLPELYPLPDGLHFTPAMSARAVLSSHLKICEIDMPYHEREGESKLSVGKDGVRFLRVILKTSFLYRPARPLAWMGLLSLLIAAALMVMPIVHYAADQAVQEWMIYRFVVSNLLASTGLLLLCASYLSRKIVHITLAENFPARFTDGVVGRFFASPYFWVLPTLLALVGFGFVASSFAELVSTGATYEHWSRFIAMSFFVGAAFILATTRILDYILDLIAARVAYLRASHEASLA